MFAELTAQDTGPLKYRDQEIESSPPLHLITELTGFHFYNRVLSLKELPEAETL